MSPFLSHLSLRSTKQPVNCLLAVRKFGKCSSTEHLANLCSEIKCRFCSGALKGNWPKILFAMELTYLPLTLHKTAKILTLINVHKQTCIRTLENLARSIRHIGEMGERKSLPEMRYIAELPNIYPDDHLLSHLGNEVN